MSHSIYHRLPSDDEGDSHIDLLEVGTGGAVNTPKMKEERQPLLNNAYEPSNEPVDRTVPEGWNDGKEGGSNDSMVSVPTYDGTKQRSQSNESYDYNPFLERNLEHPTSNLDTMIHLLKGNVGTGILAMPDAFLNAGLALGMFGTLLMGAICTHCMHILVNCSHMLCRRAQSPSLTFSQVVHRSFNLGPTVLQPYSRMIRIMVNIFLIITQLGFCCVYFVFVAKNIKQVADVYFQPIDVHWFLLLLLVPMMLLNWVKNLKFLTPVSLFAAILTCTGLGITFYYMFQDLPHTNSVHWIAPMNKWPLFFGTAIYAFEGIGVVLPLENNMANPEDFGGLTGVLNTSMVIVACLYTAVGFFGYLRYGDNMIRGSVTLNIPINDVLGQAVRIMLALAIFLSYGLQFYVPMRIIWPPIERKLSEPYHRVGELALRTFLVFVTFCLAAAIPNLSAVISLVGALSSSTLALIFPPIIELVTFWNQGISRWTIFKDVLIALFGITGFFFGTYASIQDILYPSN